MKKDINNKTEQELKKMLSDKKIELSAFQFGTTGSRTKNVKAGRTLRRDIARIMSALNK